VVELLNTSFVSPVLIGRESAVATLETLMARAATGHGQTVLIAGEAGVGKSRLVAGTRSLATATGCVVLEGHCFELDRALPYGPIIELIRSSKVRQPPGALLNAVGPAAHALARLLPELAPFMSTGDALPGLDPDHEKRRLFDAVLQVVLHPTTTAPLLLVFEDLHWSDSTSLELLLTLARRVPGLPVLLVMTYRVDEVQERLADLLAGLNRERLATLVSLAPLSPSHVEQLVRATLQLSVPVPADVAHTIAALTDGVPFFVEEVLRTLAVAGALPSTAWPWASARLRLAQVPRSVQDAVQRRLARLSGAARELAVLAAVAGRRFDVALLQRVTELDETNLLTCLRELVTAGLVVEETTERFTFRHALTREAVCAGLLARERRDLHGRVAIAAERLYGDDPDEHCAELAEHFFEAELWARALPYTRRAGQRAAAFHAPAAALTHLSRALDIVAHIGDSPDPGLYRERGRTHELLGNFDQARGDHEAARDCARVAGNRRSEWQALLDLASLWASRDYAQGMAYIQGAKALALEMADPTLLAHSLNREGNWYLNAGRPREALPMHREALTLFEQVHDRRGLAETTDLLGMTAYHCADLAGSMAWYARATTLWRELDDRPGQVAGLTMQSCAAGNYDVDRPMGDDADIEGCRRASDRALEMAHALGWAGGEAFAHCVCGMFLGYAGHYEAALTAARAALSIAEQIEHRQWMTAAHRLLGQLYLDLHEPALALDHLKTGLTLATQINSRFWKEMIAAPIAVTLAGQGALQQADQVLAAHPSVEATGATLGQLALTHARATLLLAHGEPVSALRHVEQLVQILGGGYPTRLPGLELLRAEALLLLGQTGEADAVLRAVRATALARGQLPLAWRTCVALGKLRRAQRRHREASREFAEARSIIDRISSGLTDRALAASFNERASALVPRVRPPSVPRMEKARFEGLTARERDVAARIARGETNRVIAERLYVSEGTVATHVRAILGKLGLTSRTQIAAWAVAKGLMSPEQRTAAAGELW
jgi:DNA-binding NarL/FixJ family response regulator